MRKIKNIIQRALGLLASLVIMLSVLSVDTMTGKQLLITFLVNVVCAVYLAYYIKEVRHENM